MKRALSYSVQCQFFQRKWYSLRSLQAVFPLKGGSCSTGSTAYCDSSQLCVKLKHPIRLDCGSQKSRKNTPEMPTNPQTGIVQFCCYNSQLLPFSTICQHSLELSYQTVLKYAKEKAQIDFLLENKIRVVCAQLFRSNHFPFH